MKRLLVLLLLLPGLAFGQTPIVVNSTPVTLGTPGYVLSVGSNNRLANVPATFPASTIAVGTPLTGGTSNGLLFNNANTLGNLLTCAGGVLVTDGSGVPSCSTTLPDGLAMASPTITGTLTHTGTQWSIGNGFFINSSQPANAYGDFVAPLNGTTYVDNVLTIQNNSVSGVGACGNAATRYKDSVIGYERGAIGYSRIATGCAAGFYANTLYAEVGNIGPPADPDDTDFAIVNTHAVGATHFPNTQYRAYQFVSSTGHHLFNKSDTTLFLDIDPESRFVTLNGTANNLQLYPGAAASPVGLLAAGSDSTIQLRLDDKGGAGVGLFSKGALSVLADNSAATPVNYWRFRGSGTGSEITMAATGSDSSIGVRLDDKGGGGFGLASNGGYGIYISNPSSPVNYFQVSGSATGTPISIVAAGTDSTIQARVDDKGGAGVALASNGNYALVASNASASAVNYISVTGNTTGGGPVVNAAGLDTNIDLILNPKGTGVILGTTYRATAGFNANGSAGQSATVTVRASGGASDCTLIYTFGLKTGGTC